jgi:hypothetical protein
MKQLDEIFYDALRADTDLMQAIGERIVSTCFEVGPDDVDNTPLPCVIVTDDGLQGISDTKDCQWNTPTDQAQASIEIDGNSPREVKQLILMARRAVARHIATMDSDGEDVPYLLQQPHTSGTAWDWMKPCYHSTITYICEITNPLFE